LERYRTCWRMGNAEIDYGLLFNISPVDPITFAGAALFLLTVAAVATVIPGARVFRLNPAQTLRQE
jgi:ABC-type lipoprotein release transport system permease subunit